MIGELLDSRGKAILTIRPRRFGKTLNPSMIRRFFEDELELFIFQTDRTPLIRALEEGDCKAIGRPDLVFKDAGDSSGQSYHP